PTALTQIDHTVEINNNVGWATGDKLDIPVDRLGLKTASYSQMGPSGWQIFGELSRAAEANFERVTFDYGFAVGVGDGNRASGGLAIGRVLDHSVQHSVLSEARARRP